MKVSRCMSTQHPDNVRAPFFSENKILEGDDEIKEAFYAFSHLKCKEQLWDYEGKEVDSFVVKKLLTRYEPFFRENRLGKDIFLTLRIPNPTVEKSEGKILLETLYSIPRSFDVSKIFYNEDIPPIFEVAFPMTTSHKCLVRTKELYRQFIAEKQHKLIKNDDITLVEWLGEFKPEEIRVIPLIEDKESILNADNIVREYLNDVKEKEYQRVWLARSDPALNYSSTAAVLMSKIALLKLEDLQEELSIELLPILGCGSAPFRGNFKPTNIKNCLSSYPSVQTFTIQSAFKYDYPEKIVSEAVNELNNSKKGKALNIDVEESLRLIEKISNEYRSQIKLLYDHITEMVKFIPSRRKRKLHIGLFGYSRELTNDIKLPRAIKFCASLYSYGLPPEILGLTALSENELANLRDNSPSFENDIKDSLKFLNKDNLEYFPATLKKKIISLISNFEFEVDEKHKKITGIIVDDLKKKNIESISENIERAGSIRSFLG